MRINFFSLTIAGLLTIASACQFRAQPENGVQACGDPADGTRCPDGYQCLPANDGADRCFLEGTGPSNPDAGANGGTGGMSNVGGMAGMGGMAGTAGSMMTVGGMAGTTMMGGMAGSMMVGGMAGTTMLPECDPGTHLCGVECVSDNDPATCGTSCTACTPPTNGTSTCDGTTCGGECPQGRKLCKGDCIDEGMACEGDCPDGRHDCNGLCAFNDDVNSCGTTACTPCSVPANGMATCDGTACGFTCNAEHHACGNECKRDDDPAACGAGCTVCPGTANGSAVCTAGNCGLDCNSGYHLCGGACVSDNAVESCGTSCTACPVPLGGTATCDGTQCGATCPNGEKLCQGACVPDNYACMGCDAGTHECNSFCVSDDSVNNCGTSCSPCPLPNGASSNSCDGTDCDFTCGTGYHKCGKKCAADNDAELCGSQCVTCPGDPNGVAICSGGSCGTVCNNGYHKCNGVCVSNNSVNSCGNSCTPCVAPNGGTVSCNGNTCVPACPNGQYNCSGTCINDNQSCNGMCDPGQHDCSGICVSDNSVNNCGNSCSACPQPPSNGNSSCDGTSCGIACNGGYRNCSGTNLCISNSHPACCTVGDCNQGGANTTPACNSNTCSYPCSSGYKLCEDSCVANSACCADTDCTEYSNGSCDTVSGTCTYTETYKRVQSVSGIVFDDNTTAANSFRIGEEGDGARMGRVFVTFDWGLLPNNLTLVSARFGLQQTLCVNDPYANLGNVFVDHLDYGNSLDGGDYNLANIGPSPSTLFFNSDQTSFIWIETDVTPWVQADINNRQSNGEVTQVRVKFTAGLDPTAPDRRCSINGEPNGPYLEITFQTP